MVFPFSLTSNYADLLSMLTGLFRSHHFQGLRRLSFVFQHLSRDSGFRPHPQRRISLIPLGPTAPKGQSVDGASDPFPAAV